MPHLIKLESGDYLNLDQLIDTDGEWANMNNGGMVKLSPKDLEKIEKIAERDNLQTSQPLFERKRFGDSWDD